MKLSLDWLSDFVDFTERDPQRIAERLTLGVAEVERVEVQGELLGNCVVGEVRGVRKHPNADMLQLCDVATDRGTKRVVCGGENLREGMLVAFAHVGAKVKWHGGEVQELKGAIIRGEKSEGMICAAEELGLEAQFPEATGRKVIDLESGQRSVHRAALRGCEGLGVGQPLREALGLDDVIFHVDNHSITHRADLFSHIGFARECVALGLGRWKREIPNLAYRQAGSKFPANAPANVVACKFTKEPLPFKLHIDVKKLVPRCCACLLHIDGLGETPDWMHRRLLATGWRSVNLPTDITNYVLLERGSPLHSFDADDFRGDIHVRVSKAGERVVTLDRIERELPGGALVISDDKGVFDLLGIMGGLRSSTKEGTKNIHLQCASLDPVSIRRAIIATGHRTEGATVYEKGVPPVLIEPGFRHALRLFLELVPGARIASRLESHGDDGRAPTIALSLGRVSALLGREISVMEAQKALTSLDFKMSGKRAAGSQKLAVKPPLHRLGDIHAEADVAEEIARVIGFSTFEEEMPEAPIAPPKRDHRLHRMRRFLKEDGFTEVVRFAFLGGELLRKSAMEGVFLEEIENPLGEDLRYLRSSLRPRLLEAAQENMKLAGGALRIFEIGHVFTPLPRLSLGNFLTSGHSAQSNPGERLHFSLLVASRRDAGLKGEPFLIAKAAANGLLAAVGLPPVWRDCRGRGAPTPLSAGSPYVHPARRLELLVSGAPCTSRGVHPECGRGAPAAPRTVRRTGAGVQGKLAGAVYEVHPAVCRSFDLPGRAAIATIDLTTLLALPSAEKVYEEIPEFPSITYDVTVALKPETGAGPLLKKARGSHEWLRNVELVDLFQKGEERHLTFRCTYNAGNRTLTEEEVGPIHEKVEGTLRCA